MKVINIFSGPGGGKSTTAAGIFYKMKLLGLNVELVTEFAKDLVYGGQIELLLDQQEYIFAEQNYRLHRLRDHVDYAITDSPITLGCVYADPTWENRELFTEFALATYNLYDNMNFLLHRGDNAYITEGRRQDAEGAKDVDNAITDMLLQHCIPHHVMPVNGFTVDAIIHNIVG